MECNNNRVHRSQSIQNLNELFNESCTLEKRTIEAAESAILNEQNFDDESCLKERNIRRRLSYLSEHDSVFANAFSEEWNINELDCVNPKDIVTNLVSLFSNVASDESQLTDAIIRFVEYITIRKEISTMDKFCICKGLRKYIEGRCFNSEENQKLVLSSIDELYKVTFNPPGMEFNATVLLNFKFINSLFFQIDLSKNLSSLEGIIFEANLLLNLITDAYSGKELTDRQKLAKELDVTLNLIKSIKEGAEDDKYHHSLEELSNFLAMTKDQLMSEYFDPDLKTIENNRLNQCSPYLYSIAIEKKSYLSLGEQIRYLDQEEDNPSSDYDSEELSWNQVIRREEADMPDFAPLFDVSCKEILVNLEPLFEPLMGMRKEVLANAFQILLYHFDMRKECRKDAITEIDESSPAWESLSNFVFTHFNNTPLFSGIKDLLSSFGVIEYLNFPEEEFCIIDCNSTVEPVSQEAFIISQYQETNRRYLELLNNFADLFSQTKSMQHLRSVAELFLENFKSSKQSNLLKMEIIKTIDKALISIREKVSEFNTHMLEDEEDKSSLNIIIEQLKAVKTRYVSELSSLSVNLVAAGILHKREESTVKMTFQKDLASPPVFPVDLNEPEFESSSSEVESILRDLKEFRAILIDMLQSKSPDFELIVFACIPDVLNRYDKIPSLGKGSKKVAEMLKDIKSKVWELILETSSEEELNMSKEMEQLFEQIEELAKKG